MIRLTELSCTDSQAVVKLEGYLTQDADAVLSGILAEYARRRIERIRIDVNGLW